MAIMYPADIENYNYQPSEKDFYLALKEHLSDKYHVFYSVRWFDTVKEKRVDSESDFIVFDPSFGFLTIEVKGGTGIDINDKRWTLLEEYPGQEKAKRDLKCSPYEQAEKSMRHFYDYFYEEFNQSFNGVYGFAVAFPRFGIVHKGLAEVTPELTIDINDMNNLGAKINAIFHYWRNKRNLAAPFSSTQKQKFITLINKRISLSAAAGALIPIKEKEIKKLSIVQDSIIDLLYNYKQARIVGGAGTGKTHIAIKKANRDYLLGGKVLFTCCSEHVADFARGILPSQVDCLSYEQLVKIIAGDKYDTLPKNENGYSNCFDLIDSSNTVPKYDTIVVDEAQDFDLSMGMTIRCLMKSETESSLYVFYDKNQNLFLQDFEDSFGITSQPFVLRYNIRNTAHIYQCAVEQSNLGEDTLANSLIGFKPEIYKFKNKLQALKMLTNIVNKLAQKELVPIESIVILSDLPQEDTILANESHVGAFEITKERGKKNSILFTTTKDFKGLESDVVIYLCREIKGLPDTLLQKTNRYVAITRARYYLYILKLEIAETLNNG